MTFKRLKKHTLIHGDECSGKSIIQKLLTKDSCTSHIINCRSAQSMDDHFILEGVTVDTKQLVFVDVSPKIDIYEFLRFTGEVRVNQRFKEPFVIDDLELIIQYDNYLWPLKNVGGSISRRFNIINTNTLTLKALARFLDVYNLKEHSKYYKP